MFPLYHIVTSRSFTGVIKEISSRRPLNHLVTQLRVTKLYAITCVLLVNSLKSVEILKDIWKVGHYQVSLNLTKTQVKSSTYTKDNLLLQFW